MKQQDGADDQPRSVKEAAVRQWRAAVSKVDDEVLEEAGAEEFETLDIHDRRDRLEIEEVIDHEIAPLVDEDTYLALKDAWADLKRAFADQWGRDR